MGPQQESPLKQMEAFLLTHKTAVVFMVLAVLTAIAIAFIPPVAVRTSGQTGIYLLLVVLLIIFGWSAYVWLLWPRRPSSVIGQMILVSLPIGGVLIVVLIVLEVFIAAASWIGLSIPQNVVLGILSVIIAPAVPLLLGGWYQRRDFRWRFFTQGWWKVVLLACMIEGAALVLRSLSVVGSPGIIVAGFISALGQWALILFGLFIPRWKSTIDYHPIDLSGAPYYQSGFARMTPEHALAYACEFTRLIPERMAQLAAYMQVKQGRTALSFNAWSLFPLWYWFQAHIIKLPPGSPELAEQLQSLPQFRDLIEAGQYSNETLMLGIDIGIYLCEVMRSTCPSLRWDVVREGPGIDAADIGKPALVGFPGGAVFEPFRMMWLQYDKAWKNRVVRC